MRITTGMIRDNSLNSLYANMGRVDKLYNQMNTLKKIQRPSDDPIVAGRALKLRINVSESEQHKSNVDEAKAWMDVTETSLSNMTEILKDIRTRCNQAANDTLTTDDRNKIVADIEQLFEQLKQEANTTYAGRYVFSGFKTDEPVYLDKELTLNGAVTASGDITLSKDTNLSGAVFNKDITLPDGSILTSGNAVPADTTFGEGFVIPEGTVLADGTKLPKGTLNPNVLGKIDGQDINYEIGVNTEININTLGAPDMLQKIGGFVDEIKIAMVGNPNSNPPVLPLEDDKLHEVFTGLLEKFDGSLGEVSEKLADLGSRQNRLEYTETRLLDDKTNLTELLSKTEDVDLEETYVEFNAQYMIYQSALQATSKIITTSLADFLR